MTLGARDQQVLALIEGRLTRSDPGLAALFERFSRADTPHGEAGSARHWWRAKRKAVAVGMLCLAIVTALLAMLPSSGLAARSSCGTGLSCAQTEYGCYGVSGIRRPQGVPPVCRNAQPHTP